MGYAMREAGTNEYVLFTLGSWEIHAMFEDSNWEEIFHHCKKYDKKGDRVEYAYQIPDDTSCPGCNAIQPDEIQALEQMHNMDRPTERWGKSLMEQIKRDHERLYRQLSRKLDSMCLTGDGVND